MNQIPQDFQSRMAALPAVHILQRHPSIHALGTMYPNAQIVAAIRKVLQEARAILRDHPNEPVSPLQFASNKLAELVVDRLKYDRTLRHRSVLNGSGILFHPDAGEAPMGDQVLSIMAHMLTSTRCDDLHQVEHEISNLAEAEDAVVVTSAQAAFFLTMAVFGDQKDVIVSRSQLGMRENGFRPLQAMNQAGARVIEVGATNKTHLADYQTAIGEDTGAIAVIRPTTYALRGFTQDVGLEALTQLGTEAAVPVVYDAGYTTLRPITNNPWLPSISVAEAVRFGVAATIVRGDGLIGAPACGVIIGRKAAVDKIRHHPLMPMLTPAPSVRAGLMARLLALKSATDDLEGHPAAYMLKASLETVRQRADTLSTYFHVGESVEIVEHVAFLTPYKLPAEMLPSYALSVRPRSDTAETVLTRWQSQSPALLGIQDGDRVLLDLRCIRDEQIGDVAQVVKKAINNIVAPVTWDGLPDCAE